MRENASIDEKSRCWRPQISSPEAVCVRRVSPLSRCSRTRRYSSSSAVRRNSGASSGRPSISTCGDFALWETANDLPEILFQAPHHDVVQHPLAGLDASAESLRIEDLQQSREAVGVAVVRRRRKEQAVLEARREVADGPRDVGVDGVSLAARRGRVVGFVQDQEAAWAEVAEPVAQRPGVRLVDQQALRDQKPRVGGPRVDAEAALAADILDVILVQNFEPQAEAGIEFLAPLEQHGRRAGHDDFADLLAEQKLAGDESGLDGLAQADIVGDEQVHARQAQRFAQAVRAGRGRDGCRRGTATGEGCGSVEVTQFQRSVFR